ncbi:endonuclease III domain-containing protein [Natronospora cellulosivora (SeqCode)]
MYPCSFYKSYSNERAIEEIFQALYNSFGSQNWWPAETRLETIIGAILTQSVNWSNVEMAIANLKEENLLSVSAIREVDIDRLAKLIRPSGYYNMKAKKIKAFIKFLDKEYQGNLENIFKVELYTLRKKLLNVYGIGPETADSILLYAGEYPIFVIDAYTRRIFSRIGLSAVDVKYHQLQELIMKSFSPNVVKYNEYHALLVKLAKENCKKSKALCDKCILSSKNCG